MEIETKITALIVLTGLLGAYHYQQWNSKDRAVACPDEGDVCLDRHRANGTAEAAPAPRRRPAAGRTDVCRLIDVLTLRERPPRPCRPGDPREKTRAARPEGGVTASAVTVVVVLLLMSLKSVHDVVLQNREEAARRDGEPEEARRRSLAEFADRRPGAGCRAVLARGDSANSYLAARPAPAGPARALEPRLPTRATSPRLLGIRAAQQLTRRSSVPVLPHPDVQLLQERWPAGSGATDSEDESDPRMRRVRLIRRR